MKNKALGGESRVLAEFPDLGIFEVAGTSYWMANFDKAAGETTPVVRIGAKKNGTKQKAQNQG